MNVSHSESVNFFHTIVIGSGLSGLACARRLALSGKSVCVVEKSEQLGGHLPSFERKGVRFEVGLHYIAATQPSSMFARGCAELRIHPKWVPLDAHFERVQGGSQLESFTMEFPFETFIENLITNFPQHANALSRYQSDANALLEVANSLVFPFRQWQLLRAVFASPMRWKLLRMAFRSLQGYLSGTLKLPPNLVEMLSLHHVLLGVPPHQLSAVVAVLVARHYFENPCFIEGGGQWFTSALMHEKVSYLTGENVVVKKHAGPRGERFEVTTSEGKKFARNIVFTANPSQWNACSNISIGWWQRLKLSRNTNPYALVVGYFATKQPLQDVGFFNANHWLMGTLSSAQSYQQLPPTVLAMQAPIFLSTGSLRDPKAVESDNGLGAQGVFQAMFLMPPKAELWNVGDSTKYKVPETRGGFARAYASEKEKVLKILQARLEKEFPKLKGNICWSELGTPLTHERYLFSPSRNGYGFAATVANLLLWRPSYKTSTPGLYFCGAHIKPAHGIATAMLNGLGLAKILERANS